MPRTRRLVLFGAFDRHNFGDLLLAHCAMSAHAEREIVLAGLAERDLTGYGGHRVRSLAAVVADHGDEPADFVHIGGELLTTTAWEAAVMLQTPEAAARAVTDHDCDRESRAAWARAVLGTDRPVPYVVGAAELPAGWAVHFHAVGGSAFATLTLDEREAVLDAFGGARTASVRDAMTRAVLAHAGIAVELVPDPAADTPRLFGKPIARRAEQGEVAELARRMPRWIATQLAAQWGDDRTLEHLADHLRRHARRLDAGIVLFRAGLAPWHDEVEPLERLAARLKDHPTAIFRSAHLWDLCALLRGATAYFGTSLHGWIVAHAFGVPARCLVAGPTDKAAVYVDTWHRPGRYWRRIGRAG